MGGHALIRVLVVAESARDRGAVRRLVWPEQDITVAGEAANSVEALEQVNLHPFNIAVVKLAPAEREALDLVKKLRLDFPEIGVVALEEPDRPDTVAAALRSGAFRCLASGLTGGQLVSTIRDGARDSVGRHRPLAPEKAVA